MVYNEAVKQSTLEWIKNNKERNAVLQKARDKRYYEKHREEKIAKVKAYRLRKKLEAMSVVVVQTS